MAGGSGKRGGDRVLESRHLVGLFLGVVLLCAVFFTLGYVMGRTQYGAPVHAADALVKSLPPLPVPAKAKEKEAEPAPAPASGEWDFYTKKDETHLEPAHKNSATPAAPIPAVTTKRGAAPPAASAKTVSASSKPASRFQPPRMTRGALVLQVAALRRESDALAMADAIQQKKFPSFVVAPTTDNFYRVQVGPYNNVASAESAKSALEQAGFKAIIKR
jgi:DedD protein